MDFSFTQDEELLMQSAMEFCEKEVKPNLRDWLEERRFTRELVRKCAQVG